MAEPMRLRRIIVSSKDGRDCYLACNVMTWYWTFTEADAEHMPTREIAYYLATMYGGIIREQCTYTIPIVAVARGEYATEADSLADAVTKTRAHLRQRGVVPLMSAVEQAEIDLPKAREYYPDLDARVPPEILYGKTGQ